MKKIFVCLLFSFLAMGMFAQVQSVFKSRTPEPLEFHGDRDVYFTVYVNDVIQNHRPAQCVQVSSPIDNNTTILVLVQNEERLAGRYLHLSRQDAHGLFFVVFENNLVDVYSSFQYEEYRRHRNMHHEGGYNNGFVYNNRNGNRNDNHRNHNDHQHGNFVAMSSHEFDHVLRQIGDETFDDSRLKLAKSIFSTHYFSAVQIKRVADKFTFSKNRMEFVMMAYDRCVDKEDFFVVVDAFTFKSDKDKLNKFIQQQR